MGCPLDGGDDNKIERKHYPIGQCRFCGTPTENKAFKSKTFKKYVRYNIFNF